MSGSAGRTSHESSATAGVTSSATCALDETAISVASRSFPREAITIAPPCSAALPTIATITAAMKNCDRPTDSANACSECTSVSLISAVTSVAAPSATRETENDQPPSAASSPLSSCSRLCRRSESLVTAP